MAYGFAAAGTAGHVYPALAVAEQLVLAGVSSSDIVFFGGERLEADAVPSAGFELVPLELIGLQRSFTLENLRIPAVVRRATRRAESALRARSVRAVLATGSYVTIPVAWAAKRRRIPFFVQEQNAEAGLANRLAARWAEETFTSFAVTGGLDGTYVGNPIRPAVLGPVPTPAEARLRYGIDPEARVVGVVGGTLGAAAINEAVADLVASWTGPPLVVVHLVGSRFEEQWMSAAEEHGNWHIVGFEREMRFFYAAADLVVSRAGGMVAELLATGTPSVLVPGGFGSRGHQGANAARVAESGAAVVLAEPDLAGLTATVAAVLEDPGKLASMTEAARKAGRPEAASVIAARMRETHDRSA